MACRQEAYHVAMAILDPTDDLLEELPGIVLEEPAFLHDVVKQLSRLQAQT